ncbi:hypothetical protein ACFQGX_31975 [Nonomuraea dietziae]|uniref:hypothetical protein n=1 Tax=Nonomuraea dietziae TaxID=65515 RepID=UPI00360A97DB
MSRVELGREPVAAFDRFEAGRGGREGGLGGGDARGIEPRLCRGLVGRPHQAGQHLQPGGDRSFPGGQGGDLVLGGPAVAVELGESGLVDEELSDLGDLAEPLTLHLREHPEVDPLKTPRTHGAG